jgi:hypothetical protein
MRLAEATRDVMRLFDGHYTSIFYLCVLSSHTHSENRNYFYFQSPPAELNPGGLLDQFSLSRLFRQPEDLSRGASLCMHRPDWLVHHHILSEASER